MWTFPSKTILKTSDACNEHEETEAAGRQAAVIEARCDELGIPLNIEKITVGPQVISFGAIPAEKIPIRSLGKLSAELQYALGAESVGIQTPVPGRKEVGISIARSQRRMVTLGDVL